MLAFPVKLKLSDLEFYLPVRNGPRFSNFQFSNRIWTSDSEVSKQSRLSSDPVQCKIIWSWWRRDREVRSRASPDVDVLAVLDLYSLRSRPRSCPGHPGWRSWPSSVVGRTLRTVTRNSEIQDSMDIDVLNWPGPKSVKAFPSQSAIHIGF